MALFGAEALKAALDKKDDTTTNPASAASAAQITPALRNKIYQKNELQALQNNATPLTPELETRLDALGILRRLR
jgi:hypothetical protein